MNVIIKNFLLALPAASAETCPPTVMCQLGASGASPSPTLPGKFHTCSFWDEIDGLKISPNLAGMPQAFSTCRKCINIVLHGPAPAAPSSTTLLLLKSGVDINVQHSQTVYDRYGKHTAVGSILRERNKQSTFTCT